MRWQNYAALWTLLLVGCDFDTSADFAENGLDAETGQDAVTGQDASAQTGDAAGTPMALSFDGTNDYVRLSRNVADDFTLEAWIRTTKSRGGSNFYEGLGLLHADVSGGANDFGASILNDHFSFGTGSQDRSVESSTVVTTGEWFHVAAVRTMSTGDIRVLVNGIEEGSVGTNNILSLDASATVDIGGNVIDSRYFEGTIDDVRIWNVARTNAEILATMNSRLDGTEANLVGYYSFDGDLEQAQDETSSLNHGDLGQGDPDKTPGFVPSDAPLQ